MRRVKAASPSVVAGPQLFALVMIGVGGAAIGKQFSALSSTTLASGVCGRPPRRGTLGAPWAWACIWF